MTRLILVRHGQSEANLLGIGAGQLDYPLTELGRAQAEAVADALTERESIDRIYSSDLRRAIDTAKPTAERLGLPIQTDRRLREIDTGEWAGLSFTVRAERFPEEVRRLREDYSHMRFPGGEAIPEVYRRVVCCITEILERNDGKCILITAHAGSLRTFAAYVHGFAEDEVGRSPAGGENASIQIYDYDAKQKQFYTVLPLSTEHLKALAQKTDEQAKI